MDRSNYRYVRITYDSKKFNLFPNHILKFIVTHTQLKNLRNIIKYIVITYIYIYNYTPFKRAFKILKYFFLEQMRRRSQSSNCIPRRMLMEMIIYILISWTLLLFFAFETFLHILNTKSGYCH
jgi:hypothetical protein